MKFSILILLFSLTTQGQNRTNLFKKEETKPVIEKQALNNKKITVIKTTASISGNLPNEYLTGNRNISIDESPIILPTNKFNLRFKALKAGDLVNATIRESVFAFSESKAPVRAYITSGPLKGSILIGEASLEKNSKRILIDFKKFRDSSAKDLFQIQAAAMDDEGVLGLEGKLMSDEGNFFAAEMIAAGASGYADSTINRDQNVFGNQVDSRTGDTFAKKAVVSALSKTADRFSEKLKQVPEYAVLKGPVPIQILILEQPTLNP